LELDKLGDRKTALFVIVSDTNRTFNFIAAMMYSQLFNVLCDRALEYGGRLPVRVTCLLDEFANQKIPDFQNLISVIRSRNITAHIVLQAQSQLKAVYKDHADTIVGCCSSMIFLGGKERGSLKDVSEMLGKETIDTLARRHAGQPRSTGLNYQKLGKELMTPDETGGHARQQVYFTVAGRQAVLLRKYDITKHPYYRYMSDADPHNAFNIEKFLSTKLHLKPDDVCDVYDIKLERSLAAP